VRGRGIWLSNLALVYDDLGQPDQAISLHESAISVARELHDQRGLAIRLGNLGNSHVSMGAYAQAIPLFSEAVPIYRELGDQAALAQRLGVIGNLYAQMGRAAQSRRSKLGQFAQARDHYQQTLEIARAMGDQVSSAELLRALGSIELELGAVEQASMAFEEAAQTFAALGQPEQVREIRLLLENLGNLRGTVDNDL